MGLGSLGAALLAGMLTTLSPCVLPLLPLVLGAALARSRFGPAALAAGLVVSFVAIGLFVATIGFSIGLGGDLFRTVFAVLLAALGIILLSARLQRRLAVATSGIGGAAHELLARLTPDGSVGQFVLGLLLGAVWSPCVGPTLGAASLLAAQGRDLGTVSVIMGVFGIGSALPLLAVGLLSRQALAHWRGRMISAGRAGRVVLGAGAVAIAALILSGADRMLEASLVAASPAWLTDVTTRF